MDECLKTIDAQLAELEAVIQNTQAGLYMLTEQLKQTTARRNELMTLRNTISRPLPAPVNPDNGEGGDV